VIRRGKVRDVPVLKWSGFNVIFPVDFPDLRRRICHEEEMVFDGADRRGVEAGRAGIAYYRWKKQYAGLESDQVRERRQVVEESAL